MDNRRTTIVINKKFQYQYSLLIVALAVLLVNGFIIVRMLFPGDDPLDIGMSTALALALVELILIAAIWYGSLKASHRIAGPVFVFAREVARLGTGDLMAAIELRETDMFQAEAQQMNDSFIALRARLAKIKVLAAQLQAAQAAGTDVGPLIETLAAELSLFSSDNNS